jgi:hypothetical protein
MVAAHFFLGTVCSGRVFFASVVSMSMPVVMRGVKKFGVNTVLEAA